MALATGFHGIVRPLVCPLDAFYASNTLYTVPNTSGSTVRTMKMNLFDVKQQFIAKIDYFDLFLILRIGLTCSLAFFSKTNGPRA